MSKLEQLPGGAYSRENLERYWNQPRGDGRADKGPLLAKFALAGYITAAVLGGAAVIMKNHETPGPEACRSPTTVEHALTPPAP